MSTDTKPNAKEGVKLTNKPQSMTDSLVKNPKPTAPSFFKTKTFYGLVGFFLFISIVIIWVVYASMSSPAPKAQAIQEPSPEEVAAMQAEAAAAEAAAAQPVVDPAIASLPPNDFVFSSEPIKALSFQSADNIVNELPEYTSNGAEILTTDGRFLPMSDPYFTQSQVETANMVEAYVASNRLLELRAQNGVEGWYIRNGLGFEDVDYVPLQTAQPAAELRQSTRNYAVQEMRNKLAQAPFQTRQNDLSAQAPVVVVDPALSEEERDRLLTMIETQRSNNIELVRTNKELREEQLEVKDKIVDLVQRLEDNAKVGAKLRATMIPASSGWKVSAIVGDRIYLTDKAGMMVTLAQGDRLPNSDLVISHADENTGIVLVTPAN